MLVDAVFDINWCPILVVLGTPLLAPVITIAVTFITVVVNEDIVDVFEIIVVVDVMLTLAPRRPPRRPTVSAPRDPPTTPPTIFLVFSVICF